MPTKQEIVVAIGEHIWWKNEFEKALSEGWHFLNPELAERSHESGLGLWLDEVSSAGQNSEQVATVQSLYAEFHEAAAEVVRLAADGNIDLAETSIRTGLYAQASIALTLALRNWMDSVKDDEPIHGLHTMQSPPPPPPNRKHPGN